MAEAEDEELVAGRPPRRRLALVGLVAAVVVAAVAASFVMGRNGHGAAHRNEAAPTAPVTAQVTPPVQAATDALVIGDGVGYGAESHVVTYTSNLLNDTRVPLILTGPVQALGPDGTPLPGVTALIEPRRPDPVVEGRRRSVAAVQPGQQVTLVLRAGFECPHTGTRLPAGYPHIVIPLRGFRSPAVYPFSYFWDRTTDTPGFLAGLCGSR